MIDDEYNPDETPPVNPDFPEEPEQPDAPETPTPKPMTKSILLTIKKMLGIAEEYHAFDLDVIININAVFLSLNQLGIGPDIPFQITGAEEVWNDFLGDQEQFLAGVQTYIYMRVRLMFDPPTNSFLVDSFQKQIQEFEWRFIVQPKNQSQLNKNLSYRDPADTTEEAPPTIPKEPPANSPEQPQRYKAKPRTLFDIFK